MTFNPANRRFFKEIDGGIIHNIKKYLGVSCEILTDKGKNCHRSLIFKSDTNDKIDCTNYCLEKSHIWFSTFINNLPFTLHNNKKHILIQYVKLSLTTYTEDFKNGNIHSTLLDDIIVVIPINKYTLVNNRITRTAKTLSKHKMASLLNNIIQKTIDMKNDQGLYNGRVKLEIVIFSSSRN